ncbi:sensor histidine kinase [Lutispora saccharofermentans]|uniref:histidine kinase n=1 Tax=Lutispora saccharofermentans TaxID=3024236 RepID=A0ABT1NDY6_9FIRM|nr:HAMP domain-containing sensor histidine kinase [Lutispora saccharofermentans]MCQ1528408.1 HAMP domain-containing histidine kinase [Lutispora saccharofermentans]
MLKKISTRMAFAYGAIIVITILIIDIVLIFSYQDRQLSKNLSRQIEYGYFIAGIAGEHIKDTGTLNRVLQDYTKNVEGRVIVMDNKGRVLADKYAEYFGKTLKNSVIDRAIKDKVSQTGYAKQDKHHIMLVAVPIKDSRGLMGLILISTYLDSIIKDIYDLKIQVILISFLACMLAVILAWRLGCRISKPIEVLTSASEAIRDGKLDMQVEIKRTDEIGKLADTFNRMSQEIYKTDISRKRFLSDVSHELNTPLAAIKTLVESLIDGDDDIYVYKEYLNDINCEIDRLSILVKSLLTSTRLDQSEILKENVCIYDEVRFLSRLFGPRLVQRQMMLKNNCDKRLLISADVSMLRELLTNLIDNSIKYGREGGKIEISAGSINSKKFLAIKDDGIGIPDKDLPYIFDFLYRVDKSRGRGVEGSGFGLFIVKKIAERHGWDILVKSDIEGGTEFTVIIED